ncbi:MAG: nucleoside deaminase [Bacteroidales bacterium]|jgi:guanine deaminase|nr:nucleoside deaminase [Bacteroidales bacterium]MDG1900890.1 nucleoside deaminase [Bacteroidales bacterium]MDG2081728.1 nucleoside deaminase [Bacteroidales bacterium]|tara:strand:+ start:3176 stop:3649 length:474 start_codon:yes stop_codon:yes gene_type:complete
MEENKIHMKKAIQLALSNVSENYGGPFGAVVVKDGEIIGKGSNHVTQTNDPTAHAEIVAIREATKKIGSFSLEGCEIYASCEPCPMCLGAIYWSRIDKLYYAATKEDAAKAGFDDSVIYKEIDLPKDQRSIPSLQILREDAVKVFEDWNESGNKIPY